MEKEVKTRDSKPRDVFFVCVAANEEDLYVETVKIGTKVAEDEKEEGLLLVEPLDSHLAVDDTTGKPKMIATDEELRELAVKAFEDKYGFEPDENNIRGPFYERKGMAIQQAKPGRRRRASLQVDIAVARFAKDKALANFNDWSVVAQYVENPDECISNYTASNGRAAMIMFKEPLNAKDKKKIKPNTRYVWEKDLKNIEPIKQA